MARQLATALMSKAMELRAEIAFSSYDRLFPSQDLMPQGGFGNLIALPLQRAARDHGHSVAGKRRGLTDSMGIDRGFGARSASEGSARQAGRGHTRRVGLYRPHGIAGFDGDASAALGRVPEPSLLSSTSYALPDFRQTKSDFLRRAPSTPCCASTWLSGCSPRSPGRPRCASGSVGRATAR